MIGNSYITISNAVIIPFKTACSFITIFKKCNTTESQKKRTGVSRNISTISDMNLGNQILKIYYRLIEKICRNNCVHQGNSCTKIYFSQERSFEYLMIGFSSRIMILSTHQEQPGNCWLKITLGSHNGLVNQQISTHSRIYRGILTLEFVQFITLLIYM